MNGMKKIDRKEWKNTQQNAHHQKEPIPKAKAKHSRTTHIP